MNELIHSETYLPDTIEDLTQFVLVGKAKLSAYMSRLQTVNKLSVAQSIRDQTLQETQELANALIAAEQRIGELLLAFPSAQGRRNDLTSVHDGTKVETKDEKAKEMGYSHRDVVEYQQLAKNPEIVQKVIDDALANGTVVSKNMAIKEIKALKEELRREREKQPEVKTVVREVVPEDYENLKEEARLSEIRRKDFLHMRDAYDEMADKWKKSEAEKQKLIDNAKKPEAENVERLKINAFSFCSGMSNFLESYGGYGYLMNEIDSLPDNQRKAVYDGVRAIYRWANEMLNVGVTEVIE